MTFAVSAMAEKEFPMPDITTIRLIAPDLTATTAQADSQPDMLITATAEQTEDVELNCIAEEREGGKRRKISLNAL